MDSLSASPLWAYVSASPHFFLLQPGFLCLLVEQALSTKFTLKV